MEMTEAKNGNLPRLWFSCTPFTEFGCSEISISGEIISFSISLASWSQDPVTRIKLKKVIFSRYSVKLIITKKKERSICETWGPFYYIGLLVAHEILSCLCSTYGPNLDAQPTARNVGPTLRSHEPPQKVRSHEINAVPPITRQIACVSLRLPISRILSILDFLSHVHTWTWSPPYDFFFDGKKYFHNIF